MNRVKLVCECGAAFGRAKLIRDVYGDRVAMEPRPGWATTTTSGDPHLRSDRSRRQNFTYEVYGVMCHRCPTRRRWRHETVADAVYAAVRAGRGEVVVGVDL